MKKLILMLLLITGFTAFTKAQDTTKVKKTPEERAQHTAMVLQKKLKLTADQSKQVSDILAEEAANTGDKMKGVKGGHLAKMQAAADADKKIDAILTDDQKKTYAQIKETRKAKMGKHKDAVTTPEATPVP